MESLYPSCQAQAIKLFLCIAFILFLSLPASAQSFSLLQTSPIDANPDAAPALHVASADRPPSFSTNKVIGQVALGTAFGLAAGLAGGYIGVAIEGCNDNDDFLCGLGGVALGATTGIVLGSATGVYLGGRSETVTISYGRTLLGSTAGLVAGALLIGALDGVAGSDVTPALLLITPAMGAALLGNTSRRYRSGHQTSGLLNWEAGQLHVGIPAIQQQPLSGVPQSYVRSVRLLDVRW